MPRFSLIDSTNNSATFVNLTLKTNPSVDHSDPETAIFYLRRHRHTLHLNANHRPQQQLVTGQDTQFESSRPDTHRHRATPSHQLHITPHPLRHPRLTAASDTSRRIPTKSHLSPQPRSAQSRPDNSASAFLETQPRPSNRPFLDFVAIRLPSR
ncbi:hypothetical protein VTJ04DRAFT_10199 [Mycothermus thermophilus]|uniref:uncharacterized protein n=1 Tax=Humicola insolens TaxID=85995 RepID=UPI0037434EC2